MSAGNLTLFHFIMCADICDIKLIFNIKAYEGMCFYDVAVQ